LVFRPLLLTGVFSPSVSTFVNSEGERNFINSDIACDNSATKVKHGD
jgi:hypothetical protein